MMKILKKDVLGLENSKFDNCGSPGFLGNAGRKSGKAAQSGRGKILWFIKE